MGCGASTGSVIDPPSYPSEVRKLIKALEKETSYHQTELERLWAEMNILADGRNNERLAYAFFVKHKLGAKLIAMILQKEGLDPMKLQVRMNGKSYFDDGGGVLEETPPEQQQPSIITEKYDPADIYTLFPMCIRVLQVLRKGSIAEQLQCKSWYFHLFDINEDGELSPEEMARMVKVLLENNPTMSEIITSEVAITRMVAEIFNEADDNGDGVLSLKEFLAHSKFITKKILLQNTSFHQRTRRLMKRMHGDATNDISFSKYSSIPTEVM